MNRILNTRARLLEKVRKTKEPEETESQLRERREPIDEQSLQAFDELLDEAIRNDEIQEGIHKAGLTSNF